MEALKSEDSNKIKSVLEAFSDLAADEEKKRIDSAVQLLKHLSAQQNTESSNEASYACARLIRGLGSSRDTARKGYFVAFVAFLHQFPLFPLDKVFDTMNKELEMGKFGSKGEEGEVCCGRILALGALIRAGHFLQASSEEQKYILTQMVEASSHKSYLPQVLSSFLIQLITTEHKQLFKEIIWPTISPVILKPFTEQTFDSLYLLIKISQAFPSVIKKSEVKNLFGGTSIIRLENLNDISNILFNIKGIWSRHPVYEEICKEFAASSNLAVEFWHTCVDPQLLGPKSTKSKGSLAIEIFCNLVGKMKSNLPHLLTPRFISLLRQRLVRFGNSEDDLRFEANAALVALVDKLKLSEISDSVRVQCLEKILTSARGDFGFDQVTKSSAVHSIILTLKSEGVDCIANLCTAVISGDSHPNRADDEESNDSLPTTWLNKDRISAVYLLATLATHPEARKELKSEQTVLFVEHAFFPPPGCTSLCPAAKDSLLRCIAFTAPSSDPLDTMRVQLSYVVTLINDKITKGLKPHKASKEEIEAWKKMILAVGKLKSILNAEKNSKSSNQSNLASVLLVLFMQLGVQLFLDSELAIDSLQELHLCVDKAVLNKGKKSKNNKDEPNWVEVVTDLFLSLLSQNSSMLRNIVNHVFSAMCPLLTENALLSLVQVVDCSSDENPLSVRSEQKILEEDSASGEESDDGSEVEDASDDLVEDDEEEEDTVSDRVRAAVRDALGDAGEITDTESVDVDDISEEEGQKLDAALSQAFSALRKSGSKNMTKKQSKDNKELVHFRVRVMDLIDTYMQSEQSLYLVCTLIPLLFHALEACLKDVTQKPLETRIRNCLKKVSNVKKFANLENLEQGVLTNLLQSLIEKGDRTATVFLDISHEVCVVACFIVKCSQLVPNPQLKNEICNIYIKALNNFFDKRDCLLPPTFFTLVLRTQWIGNIELWPHLITAAFDNDSVRPFRKTQALTLLRDFALNEKLLSANPKERVKLGKALNMHSSEILLGLADSQINSMKARFLKELFHLLVVFEEHCKPAIWAELKSALTIYLQSVQARQITREVKQIMKKLQNKLGVNESDLAEKSEFEFIKPKLLTNGVSSNSTKGKKRNIDFEEEETIAKKVKQVAHDKGSRRKAKELRLSSLSDGLDGSMNFSSVDVNTLSDI